MTILGYIIRGCILLFFIAPVFIFIGFFIEMREHDKKVKRIDKNYKEFWGDEAWFLTLPLSSSNLAIFSSALNAGHTFSCPGSFSVLSHGKGRSRLGVILCPFLRCGCIAIAATVLARSHASRFCPSVISHHALQMLSNSPKVHLQKSSCDIPMQPIATLKRS